MALGPRQIDKFREYLETIMTSDSENDKRLLNEVVERVFGDPKTRAAYTELTTKFNPLEGLQNYGYRPMKLKAKKDGTTETPQEMLNRYNRFNDITDIIGDLFQGIGGALAIKNQAKGQALQNIANTRSQRERDLYGANATDYAAALGAPAAQGLADVEKLLSSLISARIHGNAALSRQAEQQAVLDAYNRNVGGTGMYFDARRKTDGTVPGISNIK